MLCFTNTTNEYTMKRAVTIIPVISLVFFIFQGCNLPELTPENNPPEKDSAGFTFIYMADIHLQPEKMAVEGFNKVIDTVNALQPAFVITGGDLIMDALGQSHARSDSLYKLYNLHIKKINAPVFNTLGNHEVFGLYANSGVDTTHPEYYKKMYENRIGRRYFSFDTLGWHFIILDAVGSTPARRYYGYIDKEQQQWLKEDLAKTDTTTPIAISVHIPFITTFLQLKNGVLTPNDSGLVIVNATEILSLFKHHNLKLVLQGHVHYLEDIYINGIHFITGGAVCAGWWSGPVNNIKEGFLKINVMNDDFTWEYVEYGWEAVE